MKRINQVILVLFLLHLLYSCNTDKEINYSFFVAGHTYGKPGRTELGLCNEFKNKFDYINSIPNLEFGVLTGDIVRHANTKNWNVIDDDLKKINTSVYFSRGNHDGDLSFLEKRYGKTYKSFKVNNDIHIILDSNIGKWNIIGEQLDFLKKEIATKNIKNIFIYVHHIIWWDKEKYPIPHMNSRDRMSENLTFWTDLYPLLKSTEKPVFLFAGDVGAFDDTIHPKLHSYSYVKKDNLTLITSGMGGGKKDNFIIVEVLNDNSVNFKLIHLNGNNMDGLGKLEDYKQVYIK